MTRVLATILILSLAAVAAGAYTLDTEHPLYSYAKGVYVFDNRADDGDNIAGTGTMVGTVEDADGFDTPITQTFQSWYNNFGSAYTICIWNTGWTLNTWNPVFVINSAEDTNVINWCRNGSNTYMRVYHNNTNYDVTEATTSEIASATMLSFVWNGTNAYVYDGNDVIGTKAAANTPKTGCTTATIALGGTTTVTRCYIFSAALDTAQLGALETDPNSLFTEEEPPVEPPAKVTTPDPADEERDVPVDQVLGWAASEGATNYNVYFGPAGGSLDLMGNVTEQWYDPLLNYSHLYDWRIDANNVSGVTEGDVWTFYTETEPIIEPNAPQAEPQPEPEPIEPWQRTRQWRRTSGWLQHKTGLEGWRKR